MMMKRHSRYVTFHSIKTQAANETAWTTCRLRKLFHHHHYKIMLQSCLISFSTASASAVAAPTCALQTTSFHAANSYHSSKTKIKWRQNQRNLEDQSLSPLQWLDQTVSARAPPLLIAASWWGIAGPWIIAGYMTSFLRYRKLIGISIPGAFCRRRKRQWSHGGILLCLGQWRSRRRWSSMISRIGRFAGIHQPPCFRRRIPAVRSPWIGAPVGCRGEYWRHWVARTLAASLQRRRFHCRKRHRIWSHLTCTPTGHDESSKNKL